MNCQQALTSPQVLQMLQKDFGLSINDLQNMTSTCGQYQNSPMKLIQCITQFGNQTFKNLISQSLQDCQNAGSEDQCIKAFITNLQKVDPVLANIIISCMNFENINSPIYPISHFLPISHFFQLRHRRGQTLMIVLIVLLSVLILCGFGYLIYKK